MRVMIKAAGNILTFCALACIAGFCVCVGVLSAIGVWLWLFATPAHADTIPADMQRHRSPLIRAAHLEWGLNAPTARLAAQVWQESRGREDARSPVGAQGLAQFMPATTRWYGGLRPDLGRADAWNPGWALRALAGYDRWLYERVRGATPCDRMDKAQGSYNSGLGWTYKDEALAAKVGLDPGLWRSLAAVNAGRTAVAKRETNIYVERIRALEPLYRPWGPGCAVLEVR
jgi:soluble lytic murein transglycosylase-like protein